MRKFIRYFLVFIIGLTTLHTFGQINDKEKMSSLLVYGDKFMFSVKEPYNWIGDIDNAKEFHANIIFYRSKKDFENGGALVQVYVYNKTDENIENDLLYDIKGYQKDYKNLKQQDFIVSHKEYQSSSKLVYVEKKFHTYIVYINCGTKFKSGISVAMNLEKRPATEDEMNAFREIIASLSMFKG